MKLTAPVAALGDPADSEEITSPLRRRIVTALSVVARPRPVRTESWNSQPHTGTSSRGENLQRPGRVAIRFGEETARDLGAAFHNRAIEASGCVNDA